MVVNDHLGQHSAELDRLGEAVNRLAGKLQPVIRQLPATDSTRLASVTDGSSSEISRTVCEQTTHLGGIIDQLDELLQLIDL